MPRHFSDRKRKNDDRDDRKEADDKKPRQTPNPTKNMTVLRQLGACEKLTGFIVGILMSEVLPRLNLRKF